MCSSLPAPFHAAIKSPRKALISGPTLEPVPLIMRCGNHATPSGEVDQYCDSSPLTPFQAAHFTDPTTASDGCELVPTPGICTCGCHPPPASGVPGSKNVS